ncbi:MAG: signal peptidase I [Oscillospiraceae bacterium]|nr:signal peptidase I [Ruminococcus sp.]MBQ4346055.1 signal peptidase I [Oscillospiraceae bacterium]
MAEAVQKDQEQVQEQKKHSPLSLLKDLLDIVESVFISVFIVMLLFGFVFRPVTVDGTSMLPTLCDLDNLLMVSLFYEPEQGDIVIIDGDYATLFADNTQTAVKETAGSDMLLIKRVIATEGQTLDINFTTGQVTVDGVALDEPYIAAKTTRNDGAFTYPMTVPEGYCFVMGDNRNGSMDSRNPSVGLISEEQVMGRAVVRYDREDELCTQWLDRFAILN